MDVKATIKQFILSEIIGDSGLTVSDFGDSESLIDAGILDSLGMLKLIAFLDEEMNTNIMAEQFRLEDFATLDLIFGWVERHGGGPSAPEEESPSPSGTAESLSETTRMPGIEELRSRVADSGLEDRVVVVTGASRGLGETIAKLFSVYGSRVVVNFARSEGHAKRVADEIEAGGGSAIVQQADVSDRDQVSAMIDAVVDRWGRVDVLINSAANDAVPVDFEKLDWDAVADSIDVIVKGAFNCCKAVIPLMLKNGGGSIVNIGSLATDNPAPNQLKYVIAKSALVGLTRSLAVDYAGRGLRINLVSPSVVETDLISHIPDSYRGKIAQETPMQRNATPEDVAQATLFLASNYSRFTTGQKLMVTGGFTPFL